jgi:hypothetical protein
MVPDLHKHPEMHENDFYGQKRKIGKVMRITSATYSQYRLDGNANSVETNKREELQRMIDAKRKAAQARLESRREGGYANVR